MRLHQEDTDLIEQEKKLISDRLASLRESIDYRVEWAKNHGIELPGICVSVRRFHH